MRILATSDTHFPVNLRRKGWFPEADVFIHAGDLLSRGYPEEWKPALRWLEKLPYKVKLFVPGNHDRHLELYQGSALQDLRSVGVKCIGFPGNHHYDSVVLPNGMTMLGLPYVTNLPRWCFNRTEQEIQEFLRSKGSHDIIVSHAPMYGILDKINAGANVGIKAYVPFLKKYKPRLWINGHIHESFGEEIVGTTRVYNVAMCDRAYNHANKPVIIDID